MMKETLSYRITYAFRMCAQSCYIDGLNWIEVEGKIYWKSENVLFGKLVEF